MESKKKSAGVSEAKKAIRIFNKLLELGTELGCEAETRSAVERATGERTTAGAKMKFAALEIVPYVAPAITRAKSLDQPQYFDFTLPKMKRVALPPWMGSVNRLYGMTLKFALMLLWTMPLITFWISLFYLICGIAMLASDPSLLVKAAFMLIDAVPSYCQFFVTSVMTQTQAEIKARLR